MKIKRFVTVNSILGSKIQSYEVPEYKVGDYICDKSHFVPVSELAKSVVGQSIGKTDLARYEYPDGVDRGNAVPVARRRPELAELSVDVRRQQENVKSKVDAAHRYQEYKKAVAGEPVKSDVGSKGD